MNVAPGSHKAAVSRKVRQRIRVHVIRPSGKARVPERVDRERFNLDGGRAAFEQVKFGRRLEAQDALKEEALNARA